jgi:hypothetical protein
MLDVRRRPEGRFFYWLLTALLVFLVWSGVSVPVAFADPTTTRVSDIVYRADGSVASGVVLISWPAFTAADGTPVGAGSTSVALGNDGSLSVDLIPNAGATTSGAYYTAVFQLDDVVRTEYWVVGTTSPSTLAAVRATPGTGIAVPPASKQYVDSAIAANKAYVDQAVSTVGSGSYVSKNGDAMTGPLTLPSDPTGTNQASTKHYVDSGLSAKANLVGGVVPATQLGSGTPDGTQCLKGNSTWGACGTSSNATTIQNIAVDSTAPADGQVITYVAASAKYVPKSGTGSGNATALQGVPMDTAVPADGQVVTYDANSGKYKPKPGTGLSPAQSAPKYAGDYNWTASPSTDISTAGPQTVTLSSCPTGVYGTDPSLALNAIWPTSGVVGMYGIYIAGTGTPELAAVTGGTCKGDGNSGTLQFTTVNSHSAGYTLSSATSGIHEAAVQARVMSAGAGWSVGYYQDGGTVRVGPGYVKLYAPLNIVTPYQTIDFTGSIVICAFDADCINITSSAHDVTLVNPRGQPTVLGSQHAFIVDYAQGDGNAKIYNVKDAQGLQVPGQPHGVYGTFGYGVVDVVDEGMLVDGMSLTQITCNASFCGSAVYAPGPFTGSSRWPSGSNNAAVAWLKHLNLSLFCQNGVDWQSGNVLRISDSVIQGYGQFGVRSGLAGPQGGNGGYGMTTIDNLYEEVGNCTNVLGNIGTAGVIVNAGQLVMHGGEGPQGTIPTFANTGTTEYQYWEIPRNSSAKVGNPLYIGHAKTNGTGNIPVTFYLPLAANDFTVVRATGDVNTPVPTGTGTYAVVINASAASSCVNSVCTVTDTQAALQSYAMPQSSIGKPQWFPTIPMGVGALILGGDGGWIETGAASATLSVNDYNLIGLYPQNNVLGMTHPAIFSQECLSVAPGSPTWQVCGQSTYMNGSPATVYQTSGASGLKGRINLYQAPGHSHFITLVDSVPEKTFAVGSLSRATQDVNDAYIGCDTNLCAGVSSGVAIGAPQTISSYIGNVGDGTNWKERLTGALKTFNVPISAPGYQIAGSYGTSGQCLTSTGTGSAWAACGSGGGTSSPLTTKGDLWGFSTMNARVPVGSDGQCLVADSTNAVGVKWGSCGSGAAQDSAVVHNTGTETVGGDKTFTGNVTMQAATFTGNVTVQGAMTVSGAWQVESAGPLAPMTVGAGDSKVGFDSDGKLKVSENAGAVTEVAKVNQIPAAPVFQTNSVSNSNQGTLNLLPGANVALTPGANGAVTIGASGVLAQGPMYQPDANTVEQRNGTSIQTHYLYGTYADGSNYERLASTYVTGDGYFELLAQKAGTGTQRGVCFGGTGSCNWAIDISGTLKPFTDLSKDFGGVTLRPRDVYVGRNLVMYGPVSRYNGVATAGVGLEPVYATISLTGQTGAIASTNLCGSPSCTAGQYEITYYVDSTASCTTAGSASVGLNIGWTDEAGTKTFVGIPMAGTGVTGGNAVALGNTGNFGSGQISLWTTGTNAITYYTNYTACTSGTGTYSVRIAVKQMQ